MRQFKEPCDIKGGTPHEQSSLSYMWHGSWIWLSIPETRFTVTKETETGFNSIVDF